MSKIGLAAVLAVLAANWSFAAQAQEESTDEALESRWNQLLEETDALLAAEAAGSRIGVGMGAWAEGAVDGLRVMSVTPGDPAEAAGLQSGDIITSLDGQPLAADSGQASENRIREILAGLAPGSTVDLRYRRGESEHETQVTTEGHSAAAGRFRENMVRRMARARERAERETELELAPREGQPEAPPYFRAFGRLLEFDGGRDRDGRVMRRELRFRTDPEAGFLFGEMAWRLGGMEIAELTPALGEYFGTEVGLLVVRAPDNEEIGLEDGDVIQKIGGREFRDSRHAARILRSYEPGEKVELEVLRHKRRKRVSFVLPDRYREWNRGHLMFPSHPAEAVSPATFSGQPLVPAGAPDAVALTEPA